MLPEHQTRTMAIKGDGGLALLEVLVALVLLSLAGIGFLQLFQLSHRLFAHSREWSEAAAYAADGMEWAKLALPRLPADAERELPGGLRRSITGAPWQPGLAVVKVTVALSAGGRLDVYRLARVHEGEPSDLR